jgi:hypothetical protein
MVKDVKDAKKGREWEDGERSVVVFSDAIKS